MEELSDQRPVQVFREKLDEVVHEVEEVHECDRVKQEDELLDNVVDVKLQARRDILVRDDDRNGIHAATSHYFIDSLSVPNRLNQELHCLLEGLLVLGEEDVGVVSKQQAESVKEQDGFGFFKIGKALVLVGPPLKELGNVSADDFFKDTDQVFALRQNVGHQRQHDHTSVSNQDRIAPEEGVLLPLQDRGLRQLGAGALQGPIERAAGELGDESDSSVDIVTKALDELASLCLGYHRLLLIAAV